MLVDAGEILQIMPNAGKRIPAFLFPLNDMFYEWGLTSGIRMAAFLAQAAHESAELSRMRENMNYSVERLLEVFPKYFTEEEAKGYERQPERIASRVYANRFGNGDEASMDGWTYRAAGIFGITFRDNYQSLSDFYGIDFVAHPELVATPEWACRSAGHYWSLRKLSQVADENTEESFKEMTRRINGGLNGWKDRLKFWRKACSVLGV